MSSHRVLSVLLVPAVALCGGLDYKVSPRFSISAIQANCINTLYHSPTLAATDRSTTLNGFVCRLSWSSIS